MKARLWQSLFLLNALMTTEIVFAEDSKKDVRDLKEQNIMSVLYQQTAAERTSWQHSNFPISKASARQCISRSHLECFTRTKYSGQKASYHSRC
jgi:hypothetical protein